MAEQTILFFWGKTEITILNFGKTISREEIKRASETFQERFRLANFSEAIVSEMTIADTLVKGKSLVKFLGIGKIKSTKGSITGLALLTPHLAPNEASAMNRILDIFFHTLSFRKLVGTPESQSPEVAKSASDESRRPTAQEMAEELIREISEGNG